MSATSLDSLVSALDTLDVPCTRTTRDAFDETLSGEVREPAVGIELEEMATSLSGTGVVVDPTPATLEAATTGVTPASFAIADYGSVVIPGSSAGCELVSLYVDRHVAVVDGRDVVPDMDAAFERFGEDIPHVYGDAVVATGPSATADMGALVKGAHGPSEIRVVVVED